MEKAAELYERTLERGSSDQRQWTPQHLQAANMAASLADPSLLVLTPPQGDDLHGTKDVDVRGPGELLSVVSVSVSLCISEYQLPRSPSG